MTMTKNFEKDVVCSKLIELLNSENPYDRSRDIADQIAALFEFTVGEKDHKFILWSVVNELERYANTPDVFP